MDIRKKQKAVVAALEDVKARDIVAFDVTHLSSLFDRVIIATADSARQTKALASRVQEKAKALGGKVYGTEGEATGEWVLIDRLGWHRVGDRGFFHPVTRRLLLSEGRLVAIDDPQQVAEADREVLREILKEQQSLHAILLVQILTPTVPPRAFEVAELPHRLTACLLGRQPCRPQLVDPHLEVDAELFVHLVPDDLRPAAPVPEPHGSPPLVD